MLRTVLATRFIERTEHGRNHPLLLDTLDIGKEQNQEVFTKVSATCENGVNALITEAISAMLARDLNLPIPEPVIVNIDDEFIDSIEDEELARHCRQSQPDAFGSTKLPTGFRILMHSEPVPKNLLQNAVNIIAFDAIIQNSDRRPEKPNCLTNGKSIAIIDHDLAFIIDGIIGWQPPWVTGSLNLLLNPHCHLLFNSVRRKNVSLVEFRDLWNMRISDQRLDQYLNALPQDWVESSQKPIEIIDYLKRIRTHFGDVIIEIERVLST